MKSLTKSLEDVTVDVTDKLVGKKLCAGANLIHTNDDGLQLHIQATDGKLLEYVITNENGCPVDETTSITTTTKKKTTCWKCGKDAAGNIHCWQVPCPVIIGTWVPGKVIKAGFTLQ